MSIAAPSRWRTPGLRCRSKRASPRRCGCACRRRSAKRSSIFAVTSASAEPAPRSVRVSLCVVIVSYRTGPALNACLAAVKRAVGVDQVVLIDNGNAVAEADALDAFAADARVTLLRGQGNVGFAAGCN